jgi:hypothetical protein
MRLQAVPLIAAMLAIVSCSPPQPKRSDDNSAARKAGHAAYGVVQDSKKLAKEAGQKLRQASRDARQGWKDAERENRDQRR